MAVMLSSFVFTGCMTQSHGIKMEEANVAQIVKGKTTRAELEAMFGQPAHVGMLPEGRRILTYNYFAASGQAENIGKHLIPIVGPYIAGDARVKQRQQMLQVYLSSDGIVEDFEYTDQASETYQTGGTIRPQTTTTPIAPSAVP
jgi:outer membrane protein assembly factor BamE (lipoprotein component of BamABCDE complex)